MALGPVLIVIVFLLLVGVLPAWPYSRNWGYRPTAILAVVLALIVALLVVRAA